MTKRTPVQFRRQLLEVLRKIRDEGPIRPDFGLWVNIDEMMKCTTVVEFIVVDILINRSGGVNKTSWFGDVWKNPHMLSVMHKMISFLENDDRYVWAKPSRHELQQTENMLLKKEIAELKQQNQQLHAELDALGKLLPGTTYMGPPDGGSPTIGEQISRMIADLQKQNADLVAMVERLNNFSNERIARSATLRNCIEKVLGCEELVFNSDVVLVVSSELADDIRCALDETPKQNLRDRDIEKFKAGYISALITHTEEPTSTKRQRVSYPSGQGVLITPDQDVNGVVIALDDDGAYRRVHHSAMVKIQEGEV